jgi:beta-lactamase regulating signal transducer with metallopeptidase domain
MIVSMIPPGFGTALAAALLDSLWQDALIGLLAAMTLASLAHRSAALRHAVGMAFLVAMLLVPLLGFVAGLGGAGGDAAGRAAPILSRPGPDRLVVPIAPPLWLGGLWAAGVAAMLVRLAGGLIWVERLNRRACAPLPPAWRARVDDLRRRLGIGRAVTVRLHDAATPPFTAYALRPVIWLPVSIFTGLGPDQIEAVIAHELAHIRRLDWLWNGLQCAIEALLFHHPAMWWLSRRIRAEREHACDDLAVAACGDPIVLAEALGRLARLRPAGARLALSTNGSPLMMRVTRLLIPGTTDRSRWRLPAALLALTCSGAVLAMNAIPAAAGPRIAAPHWWEAFGDQAVDLDKTVDGRQRRYRHWVDLHGQRHEAYAVDGRPAAIDAGVRHWIRQAMIVPPPPPRPVRPPAPPAPPAAPKITDDPVYRTAVRQLAADPSVAAQFGAPVAIEGIGGPSYIDSRRADLSLRVSGPNGRALLRGVGRFDRGRWSFHGAKIALVHTDMAML